MKIGMLWMDSSKERTFAEKVAAAYAHYEQKYGLPPEECHVHFSMIEDGDTLTVPVTIVQSNYVLPHHFWIGRSDTEKLERADGS